jgi:2'-5' RNA ligase
MRIYTHLDESVNSNESWRGCLMLSLPPEETDLIQAWTKNHISSDDLTSSGIEDYTHVTILYGFPQSTHLERVIQVLHKNFAFSDIDKIKFCLGEVKKFESDDHDVIYLEVNECLRLQQIHFVMKDSFAVRTDYPTYNPHVTLAYVKRGSCDHLIGDATFCDMEVICNEMRYSYGPQDGRSIETVL